MAEDKELAKMSPMAFFIGLFFLIIVSVLVVRSVNISIKKKEEDEEK